MKSIDLKMIKSRGTYFKSINMDRIYEMQEVDFLDLQDVNYERKKKMLLEKQEKIEHKIKYILNNSKENIKSTVPIINNVNKQLMQDNLLLKIKIESMKQTSKNIVSYCRDLQDEAEEKKNRQIQQVLKDIFERFQNEMQKIKEE